MGLTPAQLLERVRGEERESEGIRAVFFPFYERGGRETDARKFDGLLPTSKKLKKLQQNSPETKGIRRAQADPHLGGRDGRQEARGAGRRGGEEGLQRRGRSLPGEAARRRRRRLARRRRRPGPWGGECEGGQSGCSFGAASGGPSEPVEKHFERSLRSEGRRVPARELPPPLRRGGGGRSRPRRGSLPAPRRKREKKEEETPSRGGPPRRGPCRCLPLLSILFDLARKKQEKRERPPRATTMTTTAEKTTRRRRRRRRRASLEAEQKQHLFHQQRWLLLPRTESRGRSLSRGLGAWLPRGESGGARGRGADAAVAPAPCPPPPPPPRKSQARGEQPGRGFSDDEREEHEAPRPPTGGTAAAASGGRRPPAALPAPARGEQQREQEQARRRGGRPAALLASSSSSSSSSCAASGQHGLVVLLQRQRPQRLRFRLGRVRSGVGGAGRGGAVVARGGVAGRLGFFGGGGGLEREKGEREKMKRAV